MQSTIILSRAVIGIAEINLITRNLTGAGAKPELGLIIHCGEGYLEKATLPFNQVIAMQSNGTLKFYPEKMKDFLPENCQSKVTKPERGRQSYAEEIIVAFQELEKTRQEFLNNTVRSRAAQEIFIKNNPFLKMPSLETFKRCYKKFVQTQAA